MMIGEARGRGEENATFLKANLQCAQSDIPSGKKRYADYIGRE